MTREGRGGANCQNRRKCQRLAIEDRLMKPAPTPKSQRLTARSQRLPLRIDLHGIKRLAYHVELGDAGGRSISVGVEDIEFRALDDVNNAAAGNGLETRDIKVLAERRFCGENGGRRTSVEDTQAATDGIGSRARINRASLGANVNAVVGEGHLLMGPVGNRDRSSGCEC